MNIVFQSGEFINSGNSTLDYIMNIVAEVIGAAIGAGAVIGLYYYQTKKDEKDKIIVKKSEANDNIFYFKNLLNSAIEEQTKQNDNIDQYLFDLRANIGDQFKSLEQTPLSNLERLSNLIGDSTFFHSFMLIIDREKEIKIESYRKITAGIDYLVKGNKQVFDTLELASPNDYNRRNIYNRNTDYTITKIRNLASNSDGRFHEISTILDTYFTVDKPKTQEEHINLLITPLLKEIIPIIDDYPQLKLFEDELNSIIRLNDEIKYQNGIVANKIEENLKDLKNTLMILNTERLILNED